VIDLVRLPSQPDEVAWPTEQWPLGELPPGVDQGHFYGPLLERPFGDEGVAAMGHTHALVVVHRGELVAERYGTWFVSELEELAGKTPGPVHHDDTHLSWSMAKSILNAVVGVLVQQGRLDPADPAPLPYWPDPDDPRRAITWDDLLQMRPGLQWVEEYYDFDNDALPDVVEMLYGTGRHDMAAFAAQFPLVNLPGSAESYNYSSGTSNLLAAATQRIIGGGEAGMRAFLDDEVFGPIGMTSARAEFDEAGTFVASSYVYASARDFARFGLLYLRDGMWDGRRILPEGWVDRSRRPLSADEGIFHGAHWWALADDLGTFCCHGFEGQRVLCVPALDLIVVRLGRTHTDMAPALDAYLFEIVDQFR